MRKKSILRICLVFLIKIKRLLQDLDEKMFFNALEKKINEKMKETGNFMVTSEELLNIALMLEGNPITGIFQYSKIGKFALN